MCAARKNNSLEESDDSAKQPAKKRKPRAATKEAKLASASKKRLKKNAAPETEDYESEAAPYAGKTEKFFGEESANVKSEKICGNDGANASGENEGAAKNPLYKDTEFFPSDGFKRHIARIKAAKRGRTKSRKMACASTRRRRLSRSCGKLCSTAFAKPKAPAYRKSGRLQAYFKSCFLPIQNADPIRRNPPGTAL